MKASFLQSFRTLAPVLVFALAAGFHASPGIAAQAGKEQPVVSPAYILQVGDELAITTNRAELDAAGAIAPDGVLYLKNIGEVRAAGLTIPQLSEQIQNLLKKKLRMPRVSASLTKLAPPLPPNKITVVGSVLEPGPRDLEEGLRLSKAIELAGGASKDADLTRVVVIHRDLSRIQVDLSTPEKVSDPKQNLALFEGDSVYVPNVVLKTFVITVAGAVAKAGPLTLDEAPRVYKVIELAGGAMREADLTKVAIRRKDLSRIVVDLSNSEKISNPAHNLALEDGDSVEVPSLVLAVAIQGAVVNAGTYELKPAMGLEDLILAAGKLTILADTKHIELRRTGEPPQVIDLEERLKPGAPKLLLKPGDQVVVAEHRNRVLLVGAIDNAGYRPLTPGQTVRDLLLSGNADTASALNNNKIDLSKAQLYRDGKPAEPLNIKQILKNPKDKRNLVLASGDIILLPGKEVKGPNPLMQTLSVLGLFSRFIAF